VSSNNASAAASSSTSAGCAKVNTDARPTGRVETNPQSRKQARCFDTVDWAKPSASVKSTTRASPTANRRTIDKRTGSANEWNNAAAGASSTRLIESIAVIAIKRC